MLPLLLQALPFIAQHGKDIAALIEAGAPIKDAVVKQAPHLWDIFTKLAPQMQTGHPVKMPAEAVAETLARHTFAPHMTSNEEKAWMDRASSTQFG